MKTRHYHPTADKLATGLLINPPFFPSPNLRRTAAYFLLLYLQWEPRNLLSIGKPSPCLINIQTIEIQLLSLHSYVLVS